MVVKVSPSLQRHVAGLYVGRLGDAFPQAVEGGPFVRIATILSLNKSVRSRSDAVDVDGMNLSSVPLFAFSGQPRASSSFVSHLVDKTQSRGNLYSSCEAEQADGSFLPGRTYRVRLPLLRLPTTLVRGFGLVGASSRLLSRV